MKSPHRKDTSPMTRPGPGGRPAVSRRAFIGNVALGLGGLLCPTFGQAETIRNEANKKAKVAIVQDPAVINRQKIDPAAAEAMVHRAVCLITGKEDRELAWKALFSPKEKVAIKVNTRYPPVISNSEIVQGVINGLKSAGIEENRIIIYDLTDEELKKAGFTLNDSGKGVRCHTTREYKEISKGTLQVKLSGILMDEVDAIVNVPAFRHHVKAGVTFSLKNHFGSVQNPKELHPENCIRAADLNGLDPIRKKTRLALVSAIRGQCNGGPGHQPWFTWNYAGLIGGIDSVAVDTVATEEIKAQREAKRIAGGIWPRITHIPRAGEMGLGVSDLGKIEVVRETV
jgi:uncharacterized protein (DUF362 family)